MTRTASSLLLALSLLGCAPEPVAPEADASSARELTRRRPERVRHHVGFPRTVSGRFAAPGTTPEEKATRFLASRQDLYRLSASPELELVVVRRLDREGSGVVLGQTFRGIPVDGARLSILFDTNGDVIATVGQLLQAPPAVSTVPALTATEAVAVARRVVGERAELRGTPTLRIEEQALTENASPGARLVWDLGVTGGAMVRVGAHDARVEVLDALEQHGFDLQLETANNSADPVDSTCYYFTNDDDEIGDEDGVWPEYAGQLDYDALYEELVATHDFFWNAHLRDSYDADGGQYEAYAQVMFADGPNASWITGCGTLQFSNDFHSDGVVTHEVGHAVMSETSELKVGFQSGALNESFGDLMAVDHTGSWVFGDDLPGGGFVRDLTQPVTMDDYLNAGFQDDYGEVHANSRIPSHAFYRMRNVGLKVDGFTRVITADQFSHLVYKSYTALPSNAQLADLADLTIGIADAWGESGAHGMDRVTACVVRQGFFEVGLAERDLDCDGAPESGDADDDADGVPDGLDNCPLDANPTQADTSVPKDGVGDACDTDMDGDGVPDVDDNCPGWPNPGQDDLDPTTFEGDACEDVDSDFFADENDNCPFEWNPMQEDADNDGTGDACEFDADLDGRNDEDDVCQFVSDPAQTDTDGDGLGDACDSCPFGHDEVVGYTNPPFGSHPAPMLKDSDHDGAPDGCDRDPLGDGIEVVIGRGGVVLAPFDGATPMEVALPAGGHVGLPLELCPELCGPSNADEGVRIDLGGLATDLHVEVIDDRGMNVAHATTVDGGTTLRFAPKGDRGYRLLLVAHPERATRFSGTVEVYADTYAPGGELGLSR